MTRNQQKLKKAMYHVLRGRDGKEYEKSKLYLKKHFEDRKK